MTRGNEPRGFRKQRLVIGSQGQLALNPLGRLWMTLAREIRQMEDRLGLTPKSRLLLGIKLAGAKKSLDQLNESLEAELAQDPR